MKTTVIIMAQGQQTRLASLGYPKQLIEVRGEPIIRRMMRLAIKELNPYWELNTICSHDLGERLAGAGPWDGLHTLTEPGDCILDGIAATQLLWGTGRTVILLGDVYYTEQAMDAILTDEREIMFAGTSNLTEYNGEIFAMSFSRSCQRQLARWLAWAPCRQIEYNRISQAGHLRHLLWIVQAFVEERCPGLDHYLPIDDETMDFDTPADLEKIPGKE
jgi:molybdopterin-guanine dinucleotide biosynthesis protein A